MACVRRTNIDDAWELPVRAVSLRRIRRWVSPTYETIFACKGEIISVRRHDLEHEQQSQK
jgi:hypothetical protein